MKKIPMRRCTGCNASKPKRELIRIVKTNDQVSCDPSGKANGRGAYVCRSIDCMDTALKTKRLERSLETTFDDELIKKLKAMIDHG